MHTHRGMDPIVFSALCGIGSGIIGYMVGGALFTATWKILFKQQAKDLDKVQSKHTPSYTACTHLPSPTTYKHTHTQMNNNFLNRIQGKRFSGVSKYEDDYYADKVLTLSDYRQWVRQQQKRKEYAQNTNT